MDEVEPASKRAIPRPVYPGDPLWKNAAYRLAVEVAERSWYDCKDLETQRLTRTLSDQLFRSACSIGANFSDGYGRGSGKDRVRFWEYSLCSTRECLFWYERARHGLPAERVASQVDRLIQIRRLLLTMIPRERTKNMGEPNSNA